MRYAVCALLALACAAPAAANPDENATETSVSQAADVQAGAGEDEDSQPLIQESSEDLTDFVTDYIRRDIRLKGAFFFEDKASGKVLKLQLSAVEKDTRTDDNGATAVTARFKDPSGAKYTLVFWVQDGAWGGLDISKIEERSPGKPGAKD
jgi:hypothetical protein